MAEIIMTSSNKMWFSTFQYNQTHLVLLVIELMGSCKRFRLGKESPQGGFCNQGNW